jgi:hypothetical protein
MKRRSEKSGSRCYRDSMRSREPGRGASFALLAEHTVAPSIEPCDMIPHFRTDCAFVKSKRRLGGRWHCGDERDGHLVGKVRVRKGNLLHYLVFWFRGSGETENNRTIQLSRFQSHSPYAALQDLADRQSPSCPSPPMSMYSTSLQAARGIVSKDAVKKSLG